MTNEEAIDKISDICQFIDDNIDDVGAGSNFYHNVRDSLISMEETIIKTNRCSPAQANAISNWESGLQKWIHDD